jgi:anti-sigma factor ChrR (cupin superfamily)
MRGMHTHQTDDIREQAALYVLGGLTREEARELETHLELGCSVCAREVEANRRVAEELAFAAPAAIPPADLRADLLAHIAREPRGAEPSADLQVWKTWQPAPGNTPPSYLQRSDEGAWEETSVAGVAVRRLFLDPVRRQATMLVRMRAGTSWPSHRHAGVEECYVLEGDLRVGDVVMRAGDYQRVEEGNVHPVQQTEEGCVLFLLSSLEDEILA